ncbi:hypothetical protein F0562_002015 [Nyssa sinensis]|uniref:Uncharacterized protein n=1 Tax=Nyssa sinensis TaxID=561372 RepID=A0A5J5C9R9_9ASTE|nr:hypothetical protein F0562_002015 [Nyssa sinensis]
MPKILSLSCPCPWGTSSFYPFAEVVALFLGAHHHFVYLEVIDSKLGEVTVGSKLAATSVGSELAAAATGFERAARAVESV